MGEKEVVIGTLKRHILKLMNSSLHEKVVVCKKNKCVCCITQK